MTDAILRQALAYARRGWPVFPCQPGQKVPATRHGYKDATTCCPALKMPTFRALKMPMAGNHNAPPVGAAGRWGR
jgi:hypothetical protein